MSRTADELLWIIQEAQQELAELRAKCTHPHYEVGLWSWRIGCINVRRICTECHDAIDGLTDEERAEYNKKNGTSYY